MTRLNGVAFSKWLKGKKSVSGSKDIKTDINHLHEQDAQGDPNQDLQKEVAFCVELSWHPHCPN